METKKKRVIIRKKAVAISLVAAVVIFCMSTALGIAGIIPIDALPYIWVIPTGVTVPLYVEYTSPRNRKWLQEEAEKSETPF